MDFSDFFEISGMCSVLNISRTDFLFSCLVVIVVIKWFVI